VTWASRKSKSCVLSFDRSSIEIPTTLLLLLLWPLIFLLPSDYAFLFVFLCLESCSVALLWWSLYLLLILRSRCPNMHNTNCVLNTFRVFPSWMSRMYYPHFLSFTYAWDKQKQWIFTKSFWFRRQIYRTYADNSLSFVESYSNSTGISYCVLPLTSLLNCGWRRNTEPPMSSLSTNSEGQFSRSTRTRSKFKICSLTSFGEKLTENHINIENCKIVFAIRKEEERTNKLQKASN